MTTIGIVTGSRIEARCLPEGVRVECSGADPDRARRAAKDLVEAGAASLVSFGLAAGLAPALRAGDLVVAEAVVLPGGERLPVDPAWRARLAERLEGGGITFHVGAVAGTDRVLSTPPMKRALFERTSALAADMESHALAEVAAAAGLPFVVVRAISDDAAQALPGMATDLLSADGHVRPTLMVGILARPFELFALLRLGLSTRRALRTLRRAAALSGESLAITPRETDTGS